MSKGKILEGKGITVVTVHDDKMKVMFSEMAINHLWSSDHFITSPSSLKGQCHEIFFFRFFSWIIFPQAPENNIRVNSNFFHLPPVSTTPVVHLELRISPWIFENIRNGRPGAWGKLIHEKNLQSKISWHCPFKMVGPMISSATSMSSQSVTR